MTSQEFCQWLRGFTEGCPEYSPTPKQWDLLKERLRQVSDETQIGTPIGIGGWGIPNGSPFITPPTVDPYNPYKITCTPGTTNVGTITTAPSMSSITVVSPNTVPFGTSSLSTSTATYSMPGSTITYTNSTNKTLLND